MRLFNPVLRLRSVSANPGIFAIIAFPDTDGVLPELAQAGQEAEDSPEDGGVEPLPEPDQPVPVEETQIRARASYRQWS
jgi:hypothetical protein